MAPSGPVNLLLIRGVSVSVKQQPIQEAYGILKRMQTDKYNMAEVMAILISMISMARKTFMDQGLSSEWEEVAKMIKKAIGEYE